LFGLRAFERSQHFMFHRFCELLRPFRREYARYLAGIVRQALFLCGGFSLVWALRLAIQTGFSLIPQLC
jgi:hypothetical protein